jgi:hypothetical protein
MTPDEIKYRRCTVPECKYKEFRGSTIGSFIAGNFVCPYHALLYAIGLLVDFTKDKGASCHEADS